MVASAYHRIEVTETILRNLPPAHNGGSFFCRHEHQLNVHARFCLSLP
jgi:hypothetical protein